MTKKIILGLAIVLGLSFCAVSGVSAIEYQEWESSSGTVSQGNLSYGMSSETIKELQQRLSKYPEIYPERLTTGYFGVLTQKAVKRFQEKKGLLQTGIVDKYLRDIIWEPIDPGEPKIGDIANPTDTDTDRDVAPTYRPTSQAECNRQCVFNPLNGYDYGVCRMSCEAGEVNISACRLPCLIPEEEGGCATVEYYCCCGNKDGGNSGKCVDSDGGINKYVKGTTCQPSRRFSASASSVASGDMDRSFCKTDYCMTVKTPGGGTYLKEYYCQNGKMMSKSFECENGCKNGACLKVAEEDCTPKGEKTMDRNCCPGLKLVPDCLPGEPCPISLRYCVDCDNGICEEHENWYNCPEDCEGVCHKELNKEECESFGGEYKSACTDSGYCHYWCECPCKTDSDCGVDRCSQGRPPDDMDSTCCYESTYKCENGKCVYTSKEYRNYSCAAYYDPNSSTPEKCLDTCGDGVCKSPENKLWCPEDCEGCIGDGQKLREFATVKGECCEGLYEISSGYRNGVAYCTSEICGNGKCQARENEWNCEEDCKTTTPPVNVQPIINMIKQAIEKLNSAMKLLMGLSSVTSSSGGGGSGSSSE